MFGFDADDFLYLFRVALDSKQYICKTLPPNIPVWCYDVSHVFCGLTGSNCACLPIDRYKASKHAFSRRVSHIPEISIEACLPKLCVFMSNKTAVDKNMCLTNFPLLYLSTLLAAKVGLPQGESVALSVLGKLEKMVYKPVVEWINFVKMVLGCRLLILHCS